MKKTRILQEIRQMRFKEIYEKRAHKRLTVEQAADLLGFMSGHLGAGQPVTKKKGRKVWPTSGWTKWLTMRPQLMK